MKKPHYVRFFLNLFHIGSKIMQKRAPEKATAAHESIVRLQPSLSDISAIPNEETVLPR